MQFFGGLLQLLNDFIDLNQVHNAWLLNARSPAQILRFLADVPTRRI